MLTCTAIAGVEYYLLLTDGATPGQRTASQYYFDTEQREEVGVWWCPTGAAEVLDDSSPFKMCVDGQPVSEEVFRSLASGRHPETNVQLLKNSVGKPRAGYDVQVSAPKHLSVLAAIETEERRAAIFRAHDRAVRHALKYANDKGLIETRSKRGGSHREPASKCVAAIFRHFTSREGDPQIHSHVVFPNMAVRDDGAIGAIDNKAILNFTGAIAALYRAELASQLRLMGLATERAGRNFQIAGMPEHIVELFSKRRAAILEIAKELNFETADNRGAAQVAAYETRKPKGKSTEFGTLQQGWIKEIAAAGSSVSALLSSVMAAFLAGPAGTNADPFEACLPPFEFSSVIDERHLAQSVFETMQCTASGDQILAAYDGLRADARLVECGRSADGRPRFTTSAIIAAEHAMLVAAKAGVGAFHHFAEAEIAKAISDRPSMAAEQTAAVRHACNADQISIVEGSAGSGKSYLLGAVAQVGRARGMDVIALAPSWKAASVVGADTNTAQGSVFALAGFLIGLERGTVILGPQTLIILDEGGMVSRLEMHRLVDAVRHSGCKLVISGDTRQLQPIGAGAPMSLLMRVLGSSRLHEIRRQSELWARAASQDFALGDPRRGIAAYDVRGKVEWCSGQLQAIDALVERYVSDFAYSRFRAVEPDPMRLVLTSRNADVRAFNDRIRASLQQQELLAPDTAVGLVLQRGEKKPSSMAFAVGDEIVFGETVKIGRVTIRNSDLARVLDVGVGPSGPILSFRLHKTGETFTRDLGQLVKRGGGDHPKLQHAFATTVHRSQGMTVDHCYIANLHGMGRESTYVAMTRHRLSARLFVDLNRVEKREAPIGLMKSLATLAGAHMTAVLKQADVVARAKESIFREISRPDLKRNASDHIIDIHRWPTMTQHDAIKEVRTAFRDDFAEPLLSSTMRSRLKADARYPIPAPRKTQPGSVPDAIYLAALDAPVLGLASTSVSSMSSSWALAREMLGGSLAAAREWTFEKLALVARATPLLAVPLRRRGWRLRRGYELEFGDNPKIQPAAKNSKEPDLEPSG